MATLVTDDADTSTGKRTQRTCVTIGPHPQNMPANVTGPAEMACLPSTVAQEVRGG